MGIGRCEVKRPRIRGQEKPPLAVRRAEDDRPALRGSARNRPTGVGLLGIA
jgi:hypothetical protein